MKQIDVPKFIQDRIVMGGNPEAQRNVELISEEEYWLLAERIQNKLLREGYDASIVRIEEAIADFFEDRRGL